MIYLIALSPVWKSLILPGWGQMEFDRKAGYVMMSVEFLSLATYFVLSNNQRTVVDIYRSIAYMYANATSFEDPRIFALIEDYYNKDAYIRDLYREAQALYPNQPELWDDYVQANSISAYWEWEDRRYMYMYQDYRQRERSIASQRSILAFVIVSNHIISALHAWLFREVEVDVSVIYMEGGLGIAFSKRF